MRKLEYLLLGVAGGILACFLAFRMSFPSIDPSIWRVYAEATGIWPSEGVTPVLWRRLMSLGCSPAAVSSLSVGLLAFCVFDIIWRMVVVGVCPQGGHPNWHRLTVPSVALLGSALAVFSEPVWRQALSGSPVLLTLALFLLSVDLTFFSFFSEVVVNGEGVPVDSVRPNLGVGTALLLAGVLVVETPVAFLLPLAFFVIRRRVFRMVVEGRYQGQENELRVFAPVRLSEWAALFLLGGGLALVCVISDVPKDASCFLRYLVELVRDVRTAATPIGWVLWIGCRIVPLVLIVGLLPVLTSMERKMSFALGVASLMAGVMSVTAVSSAVRGDWIFVPVALVRSPFMQSLGAVLSALAASLALALFSRKAFHELPRENELRSLAVWCVGIAMVVVAVVAAGGVERTQARQLRQVVADAMEETVREAKGMSWIFTDGSADVGIALVARRSGERLCAEPLIEGGPLAATNSSEALLRDWFEQGSTNLQLSAVQLGFDLWRRERKAIPVASGLLARLEWPEGECERGVAVARELGMRMVELARAGAPGRESDPSVRDLFSSVLWRLARMARQRDDMNFADMLDEANESRRQTLERLHRERTAAFRRLTDAEGLQLSLNRADFTGARHFARKILERTPDDVSANFAMGMSYLMEKNPRTAVFYLEAAYAVKPREPAILNNLAVAYLQMGELEKARAWAKKALEHAPDIPEVRETMRRIKARLPSNQCHD